MAHRTTFYLHSFLTFGKYKDERVQHILQQDPSYIRWCAEHIDWFSSSDSLAELLRDYDDEALLSGRVSAEIAERAKDDTVTDSVDDTDFYDTSTVFEHEYEDYDEDYYDAITDGQFGDYNDFCEGGGNLDDLSEMLGF